MKIFFFHYSFGRGGFVDLTEGMRLRVERIIPGTGREGGQEYAATSEILEVSYDVVRTGKGFLSLTRAADVRSRKARPGWERFPETMLASQFATTPILRIFLQDLAVPADLKTPAVLIGADSFADLEAVTSALLARSDAPCGAVNRKTICVAFDGQVSVSPMLGISVNEKRTFVPIGTTVASLLSEIRLKTPNILVRSIRIKRLFDTKYVEVRFLSDPAALQRLFLMVGDKVSWDTSV